MEILQHPLTHITGFAEESGTASVLRLRHRLVGGDELGPRLDPADDQKKNIKKNFAIRLRVVATTAR